MNLETAINLGVFPEKAITGENLAIETNFLNILQKKKKKMQKNKKIYLYGAIFLKKKCLFGFLLKTTKNSKVSSL